MTTQTIQFETVSISEVGSGTITAFLFSDATLAATLASITENATLKGRYTGTVDDMAAGTYRLVVKFDGVTVSDPNEQVMLALAVGTYIAASAVLDGIGFIEANLEGAIANARTATETYQITIGASTYGLVYDDLDQDGNRGVTVRTKT